MADSEGADQVEVEVMDEVEKEPEEGGNGMMIAIAVGVGVLVLVLVGGGLTMLLCNPCAAPAAEGDCNAKEGVTDAKCQDGAQSDPKVEGAKDIGAVCKSGKTEETCKAIKGDAQCCDWKAKAKEETKDK